MELRKVPLNDIHEKLGAKMMPFAGYNMPVRYSSDMEEHNTVREGVGIFDVSHMGEFLISGPKALELIQHVTSNDASKLEIGQAQYSCFPNTDGGIVDDLLVYRIKEEEYLLVVNASNIDKDWEWISKHNHFDATLRNISDNFCLFAIQGPKATEVLQRLTSVNLSEIKYYTFEVGDFAGVDHVILSATGYTGAGGFEIYLHNAHAEKIWNAILEAGKPENIKPIGLGARDTLRMEMGYCLYGNEIDDTTSPLEAGLGWITKFTKDFINAENLKIQKEEGRIAKKLVGFKMIDRGIPRHDYEILDENGNKVGRVTSGTMSPTLGQGIGMGYVSKAMAKPDTNIFISIRNKPLKAVVSRLPLLNE